MGKYYRLVLRLAETSGPTILPCNHIHLRQNSRFCCLKSGSSFSKLSIPVRFDFKGRYPTAQGFAIPLNGRRLIDEQASE